MNTDTFIDDVLTNLRVVGMIKKNQKLCIRKGRLSVDIDDTVQPVRRWLYSDSRETIIAMIKNTIQNAIRLSKDIQKDAVEIDMKEWTMHRIDEELRSCELGLENMRTTYHDDSTYIAMLDTLIERLKGNFVSV